MGVQFALGLYLPGKKQPSRLLTARPVIIFAAVAITIIPPRPTDDDVCGMRRISTRRLDCVGWPMISARCAAVTFGAFHGIFISTLLDMDAAVGTTRNSENNSPTALCVKFSDQRWERS